MRGVVVIDMIRGARWRTGLQTDWVWIMNRRRNRDRVTQRPLGPSHGKDVVDINKMRRALGAY